MRSPGFLASALLLAAALSPALRAGAQDSGGPPPLAPFDAEGTKAMAGDASRKPAERIAALVGILDGRLHDWAGVAAGTRTAVEGRDDRGKEIAAAVSALAGVLRGEATSGRFREGPALLADYAGDRKALEPAALEAWWDVACLLSGARLYVTDPVLSLLDAETDGGLLSLALHCLADRCPPAAVPAVLRLLRHPFCVKTADARTPWVYPVRSRAGRVLVSLGVRVATTPRDDPAVGHPEVVHTADAEDLGGLCRKWLRSDEEAEWRGALAIVRAAGRGPCTAALSIEMNAGRVPLGKLEAMSALLEEMEKGAPGGGR